MIDDLVRVASPPLSAIPSPGSLLSDGLAVLLGKKNGFFAFESALLVLPTQGSGEIPGLAEWNDAAGWRSAYPELRLEVVFFALDVFAGQFGVLPDETVVRLDPETGEVAPHSQSVADWAGRILNNYDFETGWSVAKDWQAKHKALRSGFRLLGKRPFVLGGDYEISNLVAVPCREAVAKLGALARQIRGQPDGTRITVKGWVT